ncbi:MULTISPECIES: hypothetical protein [Psychrobacter]|uniref:Uncharacterized protein n=1 Tax=Psychrobacter piechaudii TaxID=1945521 RepID=A0A1R4GTH8_9GAMM|nr:MULTISPECIES: hypothetical protein [Psychrobacter]SJM71469.1 hypothetical protein A1232T_01226 [Psychrobacter piechaudii]
MVFDFEKDNIDVEIDSDTGERKTRRAQGFAQEAILELVENDKGQIVLRDSADSEDPLVTITFSEKIKDMLGGEAQYIGHKMIHAAVQAVMQKQVSQWHANVYDEEPEHYS